MKQVLACGLKALMEQEIDRIIDTALAILAERGASVQNEKLCRMLNECGAEWSGGDAVQFPRHQVECFLGGIDRKPWPDELPIGFHSVAEVCTGLYLDPADGQEKPWNERRFADYIKVANALPAVSHVDLLGCPMEESPLALQPLYEKYFAFKYGVAGAAAIWDTRFCPYIEELYGILACETGKPIQEVFHGSVFVISPLRLAKEEAEQLMWFHGRGLRVHVGANGALGAGFPVTMAGALALHLAEYIFIGLINQALFGVRQVHLGWSISPMDMRTGAFRYGRPEKSLANIAGAQLARRLGFGFSGHAGLTDACRPGYEAAAQKASSALFTAMACGKGYVPAGLLAVDELFSPVQMVLDAEMISTWNYTAGGIVVDNDTLALEAADRQVPGGNYLPDGHTAMNFRRSLWEPMVFSRKMRSSSGKQSNSELDRARDRAMAAITSGSAPERISRDAQEKLLAVIGKARRSLSW